VRFSHTECVAQPVMLNKIKFTQTIKNNLLIDILYQ